MWAGPLFRDTTGTKPQKLILYRNISETMRNGWKMVGDIQPMCSNLGHSWQGHFCSTKNRLEQHILCFSMFLASYKDNSGGNRIYRSGSKS